MVHGMYRLLIVYVFAAEGPGNRADMEAQMCSFRKCSNVEMQRSGMTKNQQRQVTQGTEFV